MVIDELDDVKKNLELYQEMYHSNIGIEQISF